jgi:hypothetical protein
VFVWLISQQYFSLGTNQSSAINQQYFSLKTNRHQPSATSQTNRLQGGGGETDGVVCILYIYGSISYANQATCANYANSHQRRWIFIPWLGERWGHFYRKTPASLIVHFVKEPLRTPPQGFCAQPLACDPWRWNRGERCIQGRRRRRRSRWISAPELVGVVASWYAAGMISAGSRHNAVSRPVAGGNTAPSPRMPQAGTPASSGPPWRARRRLPGTPPSLGAPLD